MSGRVRGRGRVATGTVCEIDFETGEVSRYVQDVTISGFRVRDFIGSGLTAVGARDTTFSGNAVRNNADAGIWSGSSIGTRMLSNRASGSRFGLRVVGSLGGAIVANSLHHNCVGMVAINSTGPVGQFDMIANDVAHNTRACPPR